MIFLMLKHSGNQFSKHRMLIEMVCNVRQYNWKFTTYALSPWPNMLFNEITYYDWQMSTGCVSVL